MGSAGAAGTLLFFWKDDCPTSALAAPFVERIHRRAGETVRVWGVAQDGPAQALAFAGKHGLTFPVLLDIDPYRAGALYRLFAVPTLILLDAAGLVLDVEAGFRRDAYGSLFDGLLRMAGISARPLFEPGEDVPVLRPG